MRAVSSAFLTFLLLMSGAVSHAAGKPDVLLIAVDDLRPMLGCYGEQRVLTPNIDRLAKRGLVFERAYCQYAKCGTSRLSLLTGLRPDAIQVYSNNVRDVVRFRKRRPDAVSFPQWFKQHDYHTQSFGKIYHDGWDSPDDWSVPASPGRDREMLEITSEDNPAGPTLIAERFDCPVMQSPDVPDNHLFAGRMTDQVIETLGNRTGRQPTLFAVGFRRPHLPFVAPQRYFDMYQADHRWTMPHPKPSASAPIMAWFNSDGYVGSAKRIGLTMPVDPDRQQATNWNGYELRSYIGVPNRGPIPESVQFELRRAYAACVSYVDAQIGRLLHALENSPRYRNTIIILLSDHGWHLGEHSAWGKMTNFEIATRVPLIVAGPGITTGRTETIAELVDLYPTLCELTGVPIPRHIQGESLASALRDSSEFNTHSTAISQYSRFGDRYLGTALRTNRYRFVRWVETATNKVVHCELYDHASDPSEIQNLVANDAHVDFVKAMESRLREHQRLYR